ncbi:MAG: hypothetical protein ACKVQA_26235 [Burkholderiales bacterium]
MQNLINLTVGDYHGDGHEKFEQFCIKSSSTKEEIENDHNLGSIIIGFDMCRDLCAEYEDNEINQDISDLIRHFLPLFAIDEIDDGFRMDCETFVNLYMEIAKLGNPSLEYEFVSIDNIRVGGYGLFY